MLGKRAAAIDWDRMGLVGALVIGVIFSVAYVTGQVIRPYDLDCYWLATDFGNLYTEDWLDPVYCYVYPPVMAQLLYPFHVLPYAVVTTGWILLCFASLWVCLREWTLPAIALGFVAIAVPALNSSARVWRPAARERHDADGRRHRPAMRSSPAWSPGWFAIPILTKLTAGVGLLWFPFRREWRPFAIGVGITAAVSLISFVVSPAAWIEWIDFTITNYGGTPRVPVIGGFPLRVVAAVAIVAWGARTNRPWVTAIAGGIALPALYGVSSGVSVALGAYGIWRDGRRRATLVEGQSAVQPMPVA